MTRASEQPRGENAKLAFVGCISSLVALSKMAFAEAQTEWFTFKNCTPPRAYSSSYTPGHMFGDCEDHDGHKLDTNLPDHVGSQGLHEKTCKMAG